MLVLTRKAKEQIVIGDGITITLVRVKGNSVRIGIDAPKDVRVVRGELAEKDQQRQADDGGKLDVVSGAEDVDAYPKARRSIAGKLRCETSRDGKIVSGRVSMPGRRGAEPTNRLAAMPHAGKISPTAGISQSAGPLAGFGTIR
ncbi:MULTISPECIES: carbon storage regulator CsrA [Crateriforma]|uniref:Translational regulator CsrA n=1 Tax=Crateriforma conspicua TaxID=2527996 RepID=A0A5C5Y239_9PLAN|nr:Carbon storage regulator [Crateriforma conspicua]TWT69836.1 Carbon storage regulator [Crateriforma conspicua]TWU66194.1 Carbon storage regulator [Crateriforma conspicua]